MSLRVRQASYSVIYQVTQIIFGLNLFIHEMGVLIVISSQICCED